jgi:hypothetical protein
MGRSQPQSSPAASKADETSMNFKLSVFMDDNSDDDCSAAALMPPLLALS